MEGWRCGLCVRGIGCNCVGEGVEGGFGIGIDGGVCRGAYVFAVLGGGR